MTSKGLEIINSAKANGSWDRLTEIEDYLHVPDDLNTALIENSTAKEFFEQLAPSMKKQYLWWLKSAKKATTREKRLNEIIKRLEQNIKPG